MVLATARLAEWSSLVRCERRRLQAWRSFLPVMAYAVKACGRNALLGWRSSCPGILNRPRAREAARERRRPERARGFKPRPGGRRILQRRDPNADRRRRVPPANATKIGEAAAEIKEA